MKAGAECDEEKGKPASLHIIIIKKTQEMQKSRTTTKRNTNTNKKKMIKRRKQACLHAAFCQCWRGAWTATTLQAMARRQPRCYTETAGPHGPTGSAALGPCETFMSSRARPAHGHARWQQHGPPSEPRPHISPAEQEEEDEDDDEKRKRRTTDLWLATAASGTVWRAAGTRRHRRGRGWRLKHCRCGGELWHQDVCDLLLPVCSLSLSLSLSLSPSLSLALPVSANGFGVMNRVLLCVCILACSIPVHFI